MNGGRYAPKHGVSGRVRLLKRKFVQSVPDKACGLPWQDGAGFHHYVIGQDATLDVMRSISLRAATRLTEHS